ncbi:MAG: PAS domain S-box protein [Verrucomicrobiota bacterium]|jgi:PAS domain S-box-containing protein
MNTTLFVKLSNQADQAVKESERRYQRLLASVTDYVYSVTVDQGRPSATSHGPGCEAVTGFTPGEFEADPSLWYRMIYEEDRPAVLAQAERILKGEAPAPLEHRVVNRNGSIRWIRNTPVPHKDDLDRLVGYDGLVSDITERRRAEAKFRAVLESAPDAMVVVNQAGIIVLVNAQTERMFGYRREELYGQPVELLMPERLRQRHVAHRHSYSTDAHVRPMSGGLNMVGRRKDGSEFPAEISLSPLETEEGVLTCCTYRDITERKQAEEELRRSDQTQEVLNALLSISLQDISLKETLQQVIDRILAISWLSVEAKGAIFVVEADSLALALKAQRNLPASLQAACGLVPFGRCLCGRAAASGKMEFAEHVDDRHETNYEGMHPHGHYCVPIVSAGKVLGVINLYVKENHRRESKEDEFLHAVANVVGGIIQRKRAEEQLKQALADLTTAHEELKATHEELKASELQLIRAAKLESVGTLAAGVAHEVKNPLQTMLMGLDYLAHNLTANNEGAALALDDMRDAVTRANTVIRGLLELAADTKSVTKAEDLNGCVERSLALLGYELVATETTIVRQLGADLPLVPMDRGKMEQVFINLFINALHAMPHGGTLTVTTRAIRWSKDLASQERIFLQFKPGDTLAVAEVQDTGTGIPEALLPKVFDPYVTTKPVGHGTGLGLAVVKRIVDLHGGAIAIRNAPPGGVLATVVLKAQPEDTP